ncbi:MAG: DNA mismatch repair protein MutS [Crocinitomicaceae bacterium]|nr:DNA mismatch repair protein MutS [Crocinitomicaceae bacterium]
MAIDTQTIEDLEFPTLRGWLSEYAVGPTAQERLSKLVPINNFKEVKRALSTVNELRSIRDEGETFPQLDFDEILEEIRLIPIENASIQLDGFMRVHRASNLINALLYFFDKRESEYPLLSAIISEAYFTKEIVQHIEKVFDRYGNVRDDASPELFEIRSRIKTIRKQINRNFDKEVRKLAKENFLGETTETYINDRRVLTVLSNYKRRVSGSVLGSSKTGKLTYIEPSINIQLNNELELVMDDERKEIFRILQILRKQLKDFLPLIISYQRILTEFDFINAKTRLAINLDCNLPSIEDELNIELIDAYHPILWKANKAQKKKTFPQQISMDKFSRMLVISGPNAGGKSITLKSIGLLQVMLQSGLLVPVHPNSKMCFFRTILSDIGDNQSIANELSTYSYRLKRMKTFLDESNKNTLLLLDEFGTGSDPDLGGALAESMFEAFYNKKSFGVITTHYANIKLKADRLKNAVNGCMLFNAETLEPTYRFSVGQPGSSFTFEVAKMNGIPPELIDDARSKLDDKKVKMDRLLNELQKEKTYLERLNKEHIEAQETAQKALNKYQSLKDEYETKLKTYRAQSESNNKLIQSGKKMQSFTKRYITNSKKKTVNNPLMEEVRKYIAVEKSKTETQLKIEQQKKLEGSKKNSKKKKRKPEKDEFQRNRIVHGSKVKLIATRQSGVVEELKGDNITVTFGFARMKVSREKLMWVE